MAEHPPQQHSNFKDLSAKLVVKNLDEIAVRVQISDSESENDSEADSDWEA